ncbi:hypothetical protein KAT95_00505 [Candidatus Parcubacteria bacterium]|nr:hypothetical protein [Candidatus Parcubacteria bacterium]
MGKEPEPNIYEQPKKEESKIGQPKIEEVKLEGGGQREKEQAPEEIEGDYLMMTYLDEKGGIGEGIPLEISRVKKATLRKSLIEK